MANHSKRCREVDVRFRFYQNFVIFSRRMLAGLKRELGEEFFN